MKIAYVRSVLMVLILCLALAVPAFCQSGLGKIGPSNAEIAGILIGAGAAITVVAVLVVHSAHKHNSITGCVSSGAEGLSLTDKKDNHVYALGGNTASLKAGDQFALKGKKDKDAHGEPVFKVEKLTRDFGACPQ